MCTVCALLHLSVHSDMNYTLNMYFCTWMSLPMMANSMASQRKIRGTRGYWSWHTWAKWRPVTTPSLADSSWGRERNAVPKPTRQRSRVTHCYIHVVHLHVHGNYCTLLQSNAHIRYRSTHIYKDFKPTTLVLKARHLLSSSSLHTTYMYICVLSVVCLVCIVCLLGLGFWVSFIFSIASWLVCFHVHVHVD